MATVFYLTSSSVKSEDFNTLVSRPRPRAPGGIDIAPILMMLLLAAVLAQLGGARGEFCVGGPCGPAHQQCVAGDPHRPDPAPKVLPAFHLMDETCVSFLRCFIGCTATHVGHAAGVAGLNDGMVPSPS